MTDDIGRRLVESVKNQGTPRSNESFVKAMELARAYASSGSVTHYSSVARLFYDLFEMFETGHDPREKK